MPKVKKNSTPTNDTAANLGFEAQLWQAAAKLEEQFAESARLEKAIPQNPQQTRQEL